MQLRPDLETVVWCVHSENFLKERIDLIRHDLSALPQWLEKDFPDTSKNCKELDAELELAELRFTMHSNSRVYFLPDDIEYGNWATVVEWRERQIKLAECNGLSDMIEMNRLTCHYPAEAIKVVNKISRELCPLVKILLEKAKQSKREKIEESQILARYLQKAAGRKVSIATRLKHLAETSLKSPKRIKPQEFHNVCYQLKLEVEEATQGLDETLFNLREKDQSGKADAIEKLLKKLFQLISPESQKRSDNLAPLYLELDRAKNCAITLADKINQITGTEQEIKHTVVAQPQNVFRKQGNKWEVVFDKEEADYLDDLKGMGQIAQLLAKPHKTISAFELASPQSDSKLMSQGKVVENNDVSSDTDKPQEKFDKDTLKSCQKQLDDIKMELDKAEKNADLAKKERLETEKEDILAYLKSATRPSGQSDTFSDDIQKARKAVSHTINRAIRRIEEHNAPLYQHLDNSIQRGTHFAYKPDRQVNWQL